MKQIVLTLASLVIGLALMCGLLALTVAIHKALI